MRLPSETKLVVIQSMLNRTPMIIGAALLAFLTLTGCSSGKIVNSRPFTNDVRERGSGAGPERALRPPEDITHPLASQPIPGPSGNILNPSDVFSPSPAVHVVDAFLGPPPGVPTCCRHPVSPRVPSVRGPCCRGGSRGPCWCCLVCCAGRHWWPCGSLWRCVV